MKRSFAGLYMPFLFLPDDNKLSLRMSCHEKLPKRKSEVCKFIVVLDALRLAKKIATKLETRVFSKVWSSVPKKNCHVPKS